MPKIVHPPRQFEVSHTPQHAAAAFTAVSTETARLQIACIDKYISWHYPLVLYVVVQCTVHSNPIGYPPGRIAGLQTRLRALPTAQVPVSCSFSNSDCVVVCQRCHGVLTACINALLCFTHQQWRVRALPSRYHPRYQRRHSVHVQLAGWSHRWQLLPERGGSLRAAALQRHRAAHVPTALAL